VPQESDKPVCKCVSCNMCRSAEHLSANPWIFATIHRSDGHRSNGFFFTNEVKVVNDFSTAMHPLIVTCSLYPSIEAVQKVVSELNPIFVLIDPKTYKLEE
jgi:hypothetical protein